MRLSHHRQGSGPPLVLVHGIGSRRQIWQPVLARLAERHDVIALDLPGFGASARWPAAGSVTPGPITPGSGAIAPLPGPGAGAVVPGAGAVVPGSGAVVPGSVPHLAGLVADFLAELGVRGPALAGSSLGGGVALELGRRGVASSVTAFSPVGFSTAAQARWCRTVVTAARAGADALGPALPALLSTKAGRIALCGLFAGHPAALPAGVCVADARALSAAPGFTEARRALGGWRLEHPAGRLGDIPVTIAWGTRDLVFPHRRHAARARAVLPGAHHVSLPGCGHLPFADDPGACASLVLATARR